MYAWFLRTGAHPDYPAVILPSVLLIGAAFAFGFASLNIQATAGVADHEQGLASGILQTSMQVGGAVVLSVVTAIVDAGGANRVTSPQALLPAYRPALWWSSPRSRRPGPPLPSAACAPCQRGRGARG